jgi:hypothetical protein
LALRSMTDEGWATAGGVLVFDGEDSRQARAAQLLDLGTRPAAAASHVVDPPTALLASVEPEHAQQQTALVRGEGVLRVDEPQRLHGTVQLLTRWRHVRGDGLVELSGADAVKEQLADAQPHRRLATGNERALSVHRRVHCAAQAAERQETAQATRA